MINIFQKGGDCYIFIKYFLVCNGQTMSIKPFYLKKKKKKWSLFFSKNFTHYIGFTLTKHILFNKTNDKQKQ